jgi:hypothetical protein
LGELCRFAGAFNTEFQGSLFQEKGSPNLALRLQYAQQTAFSLMAFNEMARKLARGTAPWLDPSILHCG